MMAIEVQQVGREKQERLHSRYFTASFLLHIKFRPYPEADLLNILRSPTPFFRSG